MCKVTIRISWKLKNRKSKTIIMKINIVQTITPASEKTWNQRNEYIGNSLKTGGFLQEETNA